MFQYRLIERARADRRHVVLPEGEDERILRATAILLRLGVADLTLLGDEDAIRAKARPSGWTSTGATHPVADRPGTGRDVRRGVRAGCARTRA